MAGGVLFVCCVEPSFQAQKTEEPDGGDIKAVQALGTSKPNALHLFLLKGVSPFLKNGFADETHFLGRMAVLDVDMRLRH